MSINIVEEKEKLKEQRRVTDRTGLGFDEKEREETERREHTAREQVSKEMFGGSAPLQVF